MAKTPKKRDDLSEVKIKFTAEERKKILAYGCDSIVFREPAFNLSEAVTGFKPAIENVKTKLISDTKQIAMVNDIIENPLRNRVICISSFPSDARAKSLAAYLMLKAVEKYGVSSPAARRGKGVPQWHRVTGGYKDKYRDEKLAMRPAMLVLSNITSESTPSKLEKVRDILDMYEGITRVVVLGGKNPVDFFSERMFYPLDYSIWLGSKSKVNILGSL